MKIKYPKSEAYIILFLNLKQHRFFILYYLIIIFLVLGHPNKEVESLTEMIGTMIQGVMEIKAIRLDLTDIMINVLIMIIQEVMLAEGAVKVLLLVESHLGEVEGVSELEVHPEPPI